MTTTLPLYWNLSSHSKEERIESSTKLVSVLEGFQATFTAKHVSEDSGEEEGNGKDKSASELLDECNAQDVSYAIRRLIRGLASPRESSRLGFAVALTELLSRMNTISCSQILTLIRESSQTTGSMTGQEERDMQFARLFGIMSLVQSQLFIRQTPLPMSSMVPSSLSAFEEIVDDLILLGEKKSWLKESCWWTICTAIDALEQSDIAWKAEAWNKIAERIFVTDKTWSPEKVAVFIKLRVYCPDKKWRKILSPYFQNENIFDSRNLVQLARILKDTSHEGDDGDTQHSSSGGWKPQLHFVWELVLDHILPNKEPGVLPCNFQDCFRILVDENLFTTSTSAERKYWGFQVFRRTLQRAPPSALPLIFTQNFMRTWIYHLSKVDRNLHKIARQCALDVQTAVANDPTIGITLVLQMTGANGTHQFDRITRTKTVENILSSMDLAGVKRYVDFLLEQAGDHDDSADADSRRLWVVEQLSALVRHPKVQKDDEWVSRVLHWLTMHGLFVSPEGEGKKKKKKESSANSSNLLISDSLREACRTRLLACLADLTSRQIATKDGNSKSAKTVGVASDGHFWTEKVLDDIQALEKSGDVSLADKIDEPEKSVLKRAFKVKKSLLKKRPEPKADIVDGGRLLLSALLTKFYCNADVDATVLEACTDAVSSLCLGEEGEKEKAAGDARPIDVIVDVTIGLLESSTTFERTVANQAFTLLTGVVEATTVDLILTQLESRDPQADLVDDEDSAGEEAESSSEDEEEDGDESSGSDSDEDEDDAEEAVLRQKLAAALGDKTADDNSSEDDSEEDAMDDDQMIQIDEQLAAAFKSRRNESSSKNIDAQREATHFKNRVLDLVDIYFKKQPSNGSLIGFVLPLVELFIGSGPDEKQLADKAGAILRSRLVGPKELPRDFDTTKALEALEAIHTRARKARSSDIVAVLGHCSIYICKALPQADRAAVVKEYSASLTDFLTRKSSGLQPIFFIEFVRRMPSVALEMRDVMVSLIPKGINGFRRSQAFNFIQILVSQTSAIAELKSAANEFISSVSKVFRQVITNACNADESDTNGNQMKEILKSALQSVRSSTRLVEVSSPLPELWDVKAWDEVHGALKTSPHYKSLSSLHSLCQQIVGVIQNTSGPNKTASTPKSSQKRKTNAESDAEPAAPAPKAKRKKAKTQKKD